jgi:hypothetical protein
MATREPRTVIGRHIALAGMQGITYRRPSPVRIYSNAIKQGGSTMSTLSATQQTNNSGSPAVWPLSLVLFIQVVSIGIMLGMAAGTLAAAVFK